MHLLTRLTKDSTLRFLVFFLLISWLPTISSITGFTELVSLTSLTNYLSARTIEKETGKYIRQRIGIEPFLVDLDLSKITVAIFDDSFGPHQDPAKEGLLPKSTRAVIQMSVRPSSNQSPIDPPNSTHGLDMAQIVWEITGKKETGPKFLLFETKGISNLRSAIDDIVHNVQNQFGNVDIVLHSKNYHVGGNYDGNGFINAEFNRLTSKGIVVINAVGNYRNMVYNGPININTNQDEDSNTYEEAPPFLTFDKDNTVGGMHEAPGVRWLRDCPNDALCFYNQFDDNLITINLTWNDYRNTEDHQTQKDLDLYLYDLRDLFSDPIASSEKIQNGTSWSDDQQNYSSHAREEIKIPFLQRGWYFIKVRPRSQNFTSHDKLRVVILASKPHSIVFQDRTIGNEIMIPSDNPNVITVGDTGPASASATITGRGSQNYLKPDILLEQFEIAFSDGLSQVGNSSSAAIFAGMIAVLKAKEPGMWSTSDIKKYASTLPSCLDRFGPPQPIPTVINFRFGSSSQSTPKRLSPVPNCPPNIVPFWVMPSSVSVIQ